MRRRNASRDLERPGPGRSASLATALGMLVLLGLLWFFRGSCGTGMAGFLDDLMRPGSTAAPGATGVPPTTTASGGTIRIETAPSSAGPSAAGSAIPAGSPAAPGPGTRSAAPR